MRTDTLGMAALKTAARPGRDTQISRRLGALLASLLLLLAACGSPEPHPRDAAPELIAKPAVGAAGETPSVAPRGQGEPSGPGESAAAPESVDATGGGEAEPAPRADLEIPDDPAEDSPPLVLSLVELASDDPAPPRPSAATTPLDAAEREALLARTPGLRPQPGDDRVRLPSLPAPPPAPDERLAAFPPGAELPPTPPGPDAPPAPLQVLSIQPQGERELVPQLLIAFSQPMVPLGSAQSIDPQDVPVSLRPQPAGQWRWVEPSLLAYEPSSRFAGATHFEVEVPAGVTSVLGGVLEETVRARIATPPPRLLTSWPSDRATVGTETLIALRFDQRVTPEQVREHAVLENASGNRRWILRTVDDEELLEHPEVRGFLDGALPGTVAVLGARAALPFAETFTLRLEPGLPSAEGPRRTEAAQSFSFSTPQPLALSQTEIEIVGRDDALMQIWLRFNNGLDASSADAFVVSSDPPVEELEPSLASWGLGVSGRFVPGTTYTLSVGPGLRDQFGQTLTRAAKIQLRVLHPTAQFFSALGNRQALNVLDPFAPAAVALAAFNTEELDVRAYRVHPEQYLDFLHAGSAIQRTGSAKKIYEIIEELEPELLFEGTHPLQSELEGSPRHWVLGLSAGFPDDRGHLLLVLDPEGPMRDWPTKSQRTPRLDLQWAWLQRTRLAADVFADGQQLAVWVTSLLDGRPLAGARVRALPAPDSAHGKLSAPEELIALTNADGLAVLPLPAPAPSEGAPRYHALLVELSGDSLIVPYARWTSNFRHHAGWQKQAAQLDVLWHSLDDRGLYRPGETLSVTGFVRLRDGRPGGGTERLPEVEGAQIAWTLRSSRNQELGTGVAAVDGFGRFELSSELPEEMDLGRSSLELVLDAPGHGSRQSHNFQVREFRRPEYEVTIAAPSEAVLVGDRFTLSTHASYFAGGGLRDAPVAWTLRDTSASLPHPGWDGWSFGSWVPWWRHHGWGGGVESDGETYHLQGLTDAAGEHRLGARIEQLNGGLARAIEISADVTDADAQQWTASAQVLVAPAERAVGLRSARGFVRKGEAFPLEFVVLDASDEVEAGVPVELRFARREWVQVDGEWREEEVSTTDLVLRSGERPGSHEFLPTEPGSWRLSASVRDAEGRLAKSELSFWVSGGRDERPGESVGEGELTLIPDAQDYAPGDLAEILVLAPFTSGHVQLSALRSGRLSTQVLALENGEARFELPITEAHLPGLQLALEAVGVEPRESLSDGEAAGASKRAGGELPPRPAFARGDLNLNVSIESRRLKVALTPEQLELRPGAETAVQVCVRDASGAPLADAGVSLIVVDEAIHVAGGYEFADVLSVFHPWRSTYLNEVLARRGLHLIDLAPALAARLRAADDLFPLLEVGPDGELLDAETLDEEGRKYSATSHRGATGRMADAAPMLSELGYDGVAENMAAGDDAAPAPGITLRSRLSPLAAFVTDLRTDASGCVRAEFTLPERLTRWKLMAVATDGGDRFGQSSAQITTTLPLRVRASLPRFLRQGDRALLPVVIHNDGERVATVQLAAEATLLELGDAQGEGAGQRVTIPAHDRVELLVPAYAARSGLARLLLVVSDVDAPERSDALSVELPIERPTTLESFAIYGSQADDEALAQLPIALPPGTRADAGELQLDLSSTAFASLTDAVIELHDYPYQCSEQIASRQLALVALSDILESFAADGLPSRAAREAALARDLDELARRQQGDGSFGFWTRHSRVDLYVSVHVAHALQRLREADLPVPEGLHERALGFLADGLGERLDALLRAEEISERSAHVIRAYALSVRWRAATSRGQRDALTEAALDLIGANPVAEQPLEILAWLLPILHADKTLGREADAILAEVLARAVETASEASFTTRYDETERALLLHGERRTDGLLLEALLQVAPEHRLVEKLVRGLLAHRRRGAWGSTQENLFVLLALGRAFRALEDTVPDFTASAWLGAQGLLVEHFAGRDTASTHLALPMAQVFELLGLDAGADAPAGADEAGGVLTLAKFGPGRLWWRLGLRSAPGGKSLPARDAGFAVSRSYEPLDDPDDVQRLDDGSWLIKRGATVRVKLSLTATSRRHHVALVDPLPAGLEAVDTELPISGSPRLSGALSSSKSSRPWWWWWSWHDHTNLRDEQAEVFAGSLGAGVHTYSYLARATTPGDFVLPPATAEEMYTPEVFGRGAGGRVVVE